MLNRGRNLVAPAYLLACLILGGSAQGVWQNMVLQLAGLAIIAWAAADGDELLPKTAKPLLWMLIAAVAIVVVQLVPLPASIWAHGIRARIGDGYALHGMP